MHLHFERTVNAKSDCSILSLTWMGKVPDELPEDEGWKLNRTNYYQEGWLATGNIRGIVGVTFTTSHCKKNVDFPLRTNYNLRGHRSEVILVKWNEPYQKLASCDSSGIIFVWIKYEGRWSIELINDRNTPVTHFSWSHDGRMALICYQDGFVLVGSVAGQRYWSSMLNLEATITCGIWTPDDQQVYFGTTSGQIIVMDVHGAMVSQVQLSADVGITSMAWSCEKFKMEEGEDGDASGVSAAAAANTATTDERKFVLAVSLQNGFVFLLKTFDDVSPIQIDTQLQGVLSMEWSNSRELLAVAGIACDTKHFDLQIIEYTNLLKFYNERGILLYSVTMPCCQAPISALTWGHNDKRLFLATGTQIHIAWVSRRIATLQLLSRLKIHNAIQHESQLPALPLPTRIRNLIGNLFAQTIRCCVPETSALREFVSRPPIGSVRLHCTMIRHDDDNNLSSGTCYTLYLEYLGGLVPLLKGKRTSKIRPEFVIFDPQIEDINLQWSPESKSSGSSGHSNISGQGILSDSSDSDREDGCTGSPRMQRRRKRRNKSHTRRQSGSNGNNQQDKQPNNNNNTGASASTSDPDPEDLAYVDTLPEHVRLVEVTSNIWGTKFKIHGLASSVPANLGQVTYKTSLLHLQPRQMTLVMTELRDDFPIGPDPTFNPNLFSEDEEDSVIPSDEKSKISSRVSIDNCPPIAPMSPRSKRLTKPKSHPNCPPVLAPAESCEEDTTTTSSPTTTCCGDSIRPHNINNNTNNASPVSTSFVGQFSRNGANSGGSGSQRHVISPLCCEGSVPALQSPKNAVAPSDIIFDRPPAQTLISYSTSDYSNNSNNVQQVKSNILNDQRNGGITTTFGMNCDHQQKPIVMKKLSIDSEKLMLTENNSGNNSKGVKMTSSNKDLKYIDENEAIPGPSNSINNNSNTSSIGPSMCLADSMVRSCSVGYLDMVDAQLVPREVVLLMLRKDAPKRLVLVNRKQQKAASRQSRQVCRQENSNKKKLKNCGKSKSLDSSSDVFPSSNTLDSLRNLTINLQKEVIPEVVQKPIIEMKIETGSSASLINNNHDEISKINHTSSCASTTSTTSTSKLGFFASKSPLMRRKKHCSDNAKSEKKAARSRSQQKNSAKLNLQIDPAANGVPLHAQALANLEKLITRLCEDDAKTSVPASPKLPRSSPSSPVPSKKGKRPQSSSPIRKNMLCSPLLGRRNKKNKHQESSDDEVAAASGEDEVCNGTNYRDLETFQKAQLRQKLKRGKIEPNGIGNNHIIPQRREFVMHNKTPMWNENSQVYQLDFGGRVTQESAKNFQIEFRGKQVMQFGRIDGNAYTLDFQYPFSALQAFAVALANVTQRLK